MIGAGKMDRRLEFQRRQDVDDGAGNTRAEWVAQFTQPAHREFLRGGEGVMAARLESRQPVILTTPNTAQARAVGNDWRARDTRDGRIYNIRENPKEADDRATVEMLAEAGVDV